MQLMQSDSLMHISDAWIKSQHSAYLLRSIGEYWWCKWRLMVQMTIELKLLYPTYENHVDEQSPHRIVQTCARQNRFCKSIGTKEHLPEHCVLKAKLWYQQFAHDCCSSYSLPPVKFLVIAPCTSNEWQRSWEPFRKAFKMLHLCTQNDADSLCDVSDMRRHKTVIYPCVDSNLVCFIAMDLVKYSWIISSFSSCTGVLVGSGLSSSGFSLSAMWCLHDSPLVCWGMDKRKCRWHSYPSWLSW